jgi:hypothetical protein
MLFHFVKNGEWYIAMKYSEMIYFSIAVMDLGLNMLAVTSSRHQKWKKEMESFQNKTYSTLLCQKIIPPGVEALTSGYFKKSSQNLNFQCIKEIVPV